VTGTPRWSQLLGFVVGNVWATADRNPGGVLDVDLWADSGDLLTPNFVPPTVDTQPGAVALETEELTSFNEGRIFTAFRDNGGDFKLIVWRVWQPF